MPVRRRRQPLTDARRWAALLVIRWSCSDKPAVDAAADHPPPRSVEIVHALSTPGFSEQGQDSLFMDRAADFDIASRRAAILFPRDGRVVLYNLATGDVRIFGSKGQGPGDIAQNTSDIAISNAGVVALLSEGLAAPQIQVLDTLGRELWRRRLREPAARDPVPRLDIDDEGNVYVATEQRPAWDVDADIRGDPLHIVIHRFDKTGKDSAASSPFRSARPFSFRQQNGSVTSLTLFSHHVYRGDVGRLYWAVAPSGLLHVTRSERGGVDTVSVPGTVGTLVQPLPADSVSIHDDIAGIPLRRHWTPEHMAALKPVYRARVGGLLVRGEEIWLQRFGFTAAGELDGAASHYEVYDRSGKLIYVTQPIGYRAVGTAELLVRGVTPAGESALEVHQLRDAGVASPVAPAVGIFASRIPARPAAGSDTAAPGPVSDSAPTPRAVPDSSTSVSSASNRVVPAAEAGIRCRSQRLAESTGIQLVLSAPMVEAPGSVTITFNEPSRPGLAAVLVVGDASSSCSTPQGVLRFETSGGAGDLNLTIGANAPVGLTLLTTAGEVLHATTPLAPDAGRMCIRWRAGGADPTMALGEACREGT